MDRPLAGKYLLEILTKGMYSNPLHIYREYVQNSTDSIDKAIRERLLTKESAQIRIYVDKDKKSIIIRDNASGIAKNIAEKKLLSIGDSDKDGITERGFRGIGRLGGLAYADEVQFITSAYGEDTKTIMTCNCVRLHELLLKSNTETSDIMETFHAISNFNNAEQEKEDEHYFEVRLQNVFQDSELLNIETVKEYLAETVPADFNEQQFIQGTKIKEYFIQKGYPLSCYNIYFGVRQHPVYKLYSRVLNTGKQTRTKQKDHVRSVAFTYDETGEPLFIGWLAITDFSGIISDESKQGIRLRKGNILIGGHTTFAKFFSSEGAIANKMFAGEIHILNKDLLPNSQRDDFEPGEIYNELKVKLGNWANELNRKYRRGTSDANSALRKLNAMNEQQHELEQQINSGIITSEDKREKIAEELESISKRRTVEEKKVRKAIDQGTFDSEKINEVEKVIKQTESASKKVTTLSNKIINSDYITKKDLPSSYNRDERKLYQKIICVIDQFFINDQETASKLREAIKDELGVKKK